MMLLLLMPISCSLHYKCAFDIEFKNDRGMDRLKSCIKQWLQNHSIIGKSWKKLNQTWFDFGDPQQHMIGKGFIRVAVNEGDFQTSNPQNWAIEFIHQDSAELARLWCTEIALTRTDNNNIRLACIVKHAISEGWVGQIPSDPYFSVPRIIKKVICDFNCHKGGMKLQKNINQTLIGSIDKIINTIKNKNRILPVVIATPDKDGNDPVDLGKLQEIVLANANTYYLPNDKLMSFNYKIENELSIRQSMVRVYFRCTDKSIKQNRHRYYTKSKIEEIGSENTLTQLGIALSRNSKTFTTSETIRIKHVIQARELHRLKKLRNDKTKDTEEYSKLLELENEELQKEIAETKEQLDYFDEQYRSIDDELRQTKAKMYRDSLGKKQGDSTNYDTLSSLPESVHNVLSTLGALFTKKIIIHENAYDSAINFSGNDNSTCISHAWESIFHIATTLHDLIFSSQCYDLEKEFLDRTGIKLAMTEGKLTKKSKKLMSLRKCIYRGAEVDFTPHIKGKKKEEYLRIHFSPIQQENIILICHCGEHLETYGTQKM